MADAVDIEIPEEQKTAEPYAPKPEEQKVADYVFQRVDAMKEYRKQKLGGNNRSIEDIWKDADEEYQPHELTMSTTKRFESNDEQGLRSRLVKVGEADNWQSNIASPDLYVKVNTALAILVDQNPEAVFLPSSRKYQANTTLAYGNWKNSWEVSGSKQQLKNVIFNMAKYGNGFMRTYPKIVRMKKKIRTEYYPGEPDKDVYEEREITKFNDICRESLNPKQVWLSENFKPGNQESLEDWYYEKDFSPEAFDKEFADYKGKKYAAPGAQEVKEGETDSEKPSKNITVGYYENQLLDIYAIVIPSAKAIVYVSPLTNDDGKLSLSVFMWTLRADDSPWGIGLYEIIRNDVVMYDRLLNMNMDQLTLSIYKMFFYKGTDTIGENGKLSISPGVGEQVIDPTSIQFLEVPGPGIESWKGLEFLQQRKDTMSGVTPQLMANMGGKTLGQDLVAKEAALERMKTPLDYILDGLQNEAYLTISWQKQTLSTPEILEYTDPETLVAALKEMGLDDEAIKAYEEEAAGKGNGELLFQGQPNEEGQSKQYANVYKEVPFSLEKDEKGELIESNERRFYRFGVDLPTSRLAWEGIIRIKPQSILAPSKELTRRTKLDLFNLVYPAIQAMLAAPQHIPHLLGPIKQIVKVYDEDEKDWVDEEGLMSLAEQALQPSEKPPEPPKLTFSIDFETLLPEVRKQVLEKYAGIKVEDPLFVDAVTGEGQPEVSGMPDLSALMGGGQPPAEGIEPLVNRQSVGGGQAISGNPIQLGQ